MNRKAQMACNFNCIFEIEEFLKVTSSHIYCRSGNIMETVQDRDVVPTWSPIASDVSYMGYATVTIPMTLSVLKGYKFAYCKPFPIGCFKFLPKVRL